MLRTANVINTSVLSALFPLFEKKLTAIIPVWLQYLLGASRRLKDSKLEDGKNMFRSAAIAIFLSKSKILIPGRIQRRLMLKSAFYIKGIVLMTVNCK